MVDLSLSFLNHDSWKKCVTLEQRRAFFVKELGFIPVIIFLDDDQTALEIFREHVESLAFESFCSSDSDQAASFFRENIYRVFMVVSDFQLGNCTGFDFRNMLPDLRDISFVVLSGFVDREMALQGLALKIAAFYEKPISLDKITELISANGKKRFESLKEEHEILKSFLADAEAIVVDMESTILELQSHPNDKESLARVYGMLHTLKGSSGFFTPKTFHKFAHAFEDQIKMVQSGGTNLNEDTIFCWLKGLDVLKLLLGEFSKFNHKNHNVDELCKVFKSTSVSIENCSEVEGAKEQQKTFNHGTPRSQDIRVSMEMLNGFMQISGEMTVIRNMINKSVKGLEKRYGGDRDIQMLSELLEEMHKINLATQSKINEIRKVGLRSLVQAINRTAKETARSLGKELDFIVKGDHIRVDNSIADVLSMSLVHLIRNSIDHGLEKNAEQRITNGKNPRGSVELSFEQQDDFIVVKIKDDGRGINVVKIKEKALENNLATAEAFQKMEPEQLYSLIFEAGFSTAEVTTDFSGRGVGMSMVKDAIGSLNGSIHIQSAANVGSTFTLKIPIPKSVLIANCLFVRSAGKEYGIVRDNIVKIIECSQLGGNGMESISGSLYLRLENRLIPVASLGDILGAKASESQENFLVVLRSEKFEFAFLVDGVEDIEDSVIKSIYVHQIKDLGLYTGATFLADGSVGLILDVDGIGHHLGITAGRSQQAVVNKMNPEKASLERSFITFQLKSDGVYCLQDKDVLRIEEIRFDQIQRSSQWSLLPYRGSMLYLIDVEKVLSRQNWREFNSIDYQEPVSVMVVESNGRYLGLVIRNLLELEKSTQDLLPLTVPRFGIQGYLVLNGRTVTSIDLLKIKNLIDSGEAIVAAA